MIQPHDDPRCEEALDWIEPYLDGDLPGEEAARLREHLGRCPACAAELQLAERIQRELRALPQLDCPPEVLERVERAGRGEVVAFRPRQRTSLRLTAAAALLALSVGGGALFLRLQRSSDQPSPEEVAQATAEAKLALAYLGRATRRASVDLQQEVLAKRLVVPATRGVVRSLGTERSDKGVLR
ncbi:MAG TPA: zf-HC2 domain-containing protein [Thermoanaerobaculia bacterium]|jgi:anti-sigma factor RsiW|nr:zf-HC2 domain-containing protein [Thermoanaerobaculia bacterium]